MLHCFSSCLQIFQYEECEGEGNKKNKESTTETSSAGGNKDIESYKEMGMSLVCW
jgi:hypothetical protein